MAKKLSFLNHNHPSSASPSSAKDASSAPDRTANTKRGLYSAKAGLSCSPKGRFLSEVAALWALICVPINVVSFYLLLTLPEYVHVEADDIDGGSVNATELPGGSGPVNASESDPATEDGFYSVQDFRNWTDEIVSGDENSSSIYLTGDLECFLPMAEHSAASADREYWLSGVALLAIGVAGIVGNALTLVILFKYETKTTFNRLLVYLSLADLLLIVTFVAEFSIFNVFLAGQPLWYRIGFPYFFHPLKHFLLSEGILLMVAVSAERCQAICHPLRERPSPSCYVAAVTVISASLNFRKFFEMRVNEEGDDYETTRLMESQLYLEMSNVWQELLVTGLVPILALIYCNLRIYCKIRESSQHETHRHVGGTFRHRRRSPSGAGYQTGGGGGASVASTEPVPLTPLTPSSANATGNSNSGGGFLWRSSSKFRARLSPKPSFLERQPSLSTPPSLRVTRAPSSTGESDLDLDDPESRPRSEVKVRSDAEGGRKRGGYRWKTSISRKRLNLPPPPPPSSPDIQTSKEASSAAGQPLANGGQHHGGASIVNRSSPPASEVSLEMQRRNPPPRPPRQQRFTFRAPTAVGGSRNGVMASTTMGTIRRRHEKSVMILVLIVVIFIACHSFRLSVQTYQVANSAQIGKDAYDRCFRLGRSHVSVHFMALSSANNLFLVANCAINFVVYCAVRKTFRRSLIRLVTCGAVSRRRFAAQNTAGGSNGGGGNITCGGGGGEASAMLVVAGGNHNGTGVASNRGVVATSV